MSGEVEQLNIMSLMVMPIGKLVVNSKSNIYEESMFQNKHIFVAGGRTGFIGTNISRGLLNRGAVVYAHSLHPAKASFFERDTPKLVELSGDLSVAAPLPPRVDYVFHCAAHTSGAHEMVTNPVAQITSNLFMMFFCLIIEFSRLRFRRR